MSANDKPPRSEISLGEIDALVHRYREATEAADESPGSHVRRTVLAEAARLAREQNAPKRNEALTKKRAANDGAWRYAAAASIVMAGVAAFIVNQWQSGESEFIVNEGGRVASAPVDSAATSAPAPMSASAEKAEAAAPVAAASQSAAAEVAPSVATATASAPAAASGTAPPARAANSKPQPAVESTARAPLGQEATPRPADARSRAPEVSVSGGDVAQSQASTAGASVARSANAAPPSAPQIASAPAPTAASPAPPTVFAAPAAPAPMASSSVASEPLSGSREAAIDVARSATGQTQKRAAMPSASESREMTANALPSAPPPRMGQVTEGARGGMVIVQANGSLRVGIQQNDLSLVQGALRTGADANLIDANGTPVLSVAIQRGATDIALALLGAGADPNRLDRQGKSARDYAEASGNRAIIEAMKR